MRRHKQKPPGSTRALQLLADAGTAGLAAGSLAAAGYSPHAVLGLVRQGLASPNATQPADMSCVYDLSRVTITEAGRAALTDRTDKR